jgi:ATP-dependent helicase/nuclease subunit B
LSINVKTIAPGAPFLRTLVAACIDGSLGIRFPKDERDYSAATIYVPTRRAARALAHAFAERLQPRAVLLPRIVPLGDPSDLEERAILTSDSFGADADVPPAIGDLERRLLLTSLIEGWRNSRDMKQMAAAGDGFTIGGGFADSFALSGDLASLIDEFAIEGVEWRRVRDLTQGQFDEYWSMTRDFLAIAGEAWPLALKELGQLDPATRLNRLLTAEAERLKRERPDHPVIAAGSTGTVPATAGLLAAISRLPNGVVVLPGLDKTMDERGWTLVADQPDPGAAQPGHPQAALKRLLSRLGVEREGVDEIGVSTDALLHRMELVHAASRAAEVTDDWPEMRGDLAASLADGLDGISVIEAPDERTEALAIAVALREVLETDGKTAALVTPDRAMAQRVSLELRRWGIAADDSAGTPLDASPLGAFARLVARAVTEDFTATSTMSMLSHACLCVGTPDAACVFEMLGLRGHDLGQGLAGIAASLDDAQDRIDDYRSPAPLRRISAEGLEKAKALLAAFVTAMQPLALLVEKAHPLSHLAMSHMQAIEALAGDRAATGADAVALGRVFDQLLSTKADPVITFADYAALFDMLIAGAMISPAQPVQGRIKIWGLLEARLMEADRIVLGGLNEGIWPPEVRTDPFLNRSMRTELGLSSPERRIGQSAHDFAQALGAPEAIIARAMTVEGTPMVASRFLRRLDAFVGEAAAKAMRSRGQWLIQAAAAMDEAPVVPAAPRPDPRPDATLQPTSLSVTEIGTLVRDPYAIYARHVLGLQALEVLETSVDARDRGTIIHEVLAKFIKASQQNWPADPLGDLLERGRIEFEPYKHIESVSAFWWPVFEKVATWFVDWEQARRKSVARSEVERSGALTVPLADGTAFKLRARADRIDVSADGTLSLLDYKTGKPPSGDQIALGLDPQLTLMAHMAALGLFENVPAAHVGTIAHVKLGADSREIVPKVDRKAIAADDIERLATRHIAGLKNTLDKLRRKEDGFLSRRMIEKARDGGDYDHLARVKEWMAEVGD